MKLSTVLAPAMGLIGAVSAGKPHWGQTGTAESTYWTTIVTTAYTTYCPVCLGYNPQVFRLQPILTLSPSPRPPLYTTT